MRVLCGWGARLGSMYGEGLAPKSKSVMYDRSMRWRRAAFMSAPLLFALLARCGDDPLTKLKPQIEVVPASLDFGEGIVNQDNMLQLTVKNRGSGELDIASVSVDGAAFSVKAFPNIVPALSDRPLPVIFVPLKAHDVYDGTVTITSNDPFH